ncbi:maleylpyruvate isomerase family mycothiol-dependent enzyme [Streptomyces sp. CC208A]|uniref:maleylpyruvate isomerase family mycothiol-dependent enzyme n=1 Tax=Streptomyces sp. CC208A TaxID=3044573 RepID=UPI0024A7EFA2|nr:maleylpyruvate isomerase family mycothiol-dependent enzyme [Streptomyces sp. CC208A]
MKIAEHIDALEAAGRGLAEAAEAAGPDAEVPTCPGWRMRDLLRHTTMVHRWAAGFVVEGHTAYQPEGDEPRLDGDALFAHFREGHAELVAALRAAPETLTAWTFLPAPSPLAFWARRQAHETAVHRADAESALPTGPGPVEAGLAADGVDELLAGFHARDRSRVRTDGPRSLRIRATDTGDVWTVRLSAEPPVTERAAAGGPADAEVSGTAERLYLTLWNRLPASAVTVTGDADLLRLWRETSAIV